ncbi:MAG: polysaccharide deacetylase family protein [Bacteroidota bacterium]|nr:polysaccharide deacetylase family protein [Bacteroidota bacterium]
MLLVYVPEITRRISYIYSLVFEDLLGYKLELTTSLDDYRSCSGPRIACSKVPIDSGLFLKSDGLLYEKEIHEQHITLSTYEGLPVFFSHNDPDSILPFDLMSASFYLVTRYEEYFPFEADRHGRFSSNQSLAYKNGFLQSPLVNLWAAKLGEKISNAFPLEDPERIQFRFVPTIDIDHAFAYRGRNLLRTAGGYLRSFSGMDWNEISTRTRVLFRKMEDPFDIYEMISSIHKEAGLSPLFFILFSDRGGGNDNNVRLSNLNFRDLLLQLDEHENVGLHPSLRSNRRFDLLESEYRGLSNSLGRDVTASRQHFLYLSFPDTYRNLVRLGITDDYSLSYSEIPGFRASIASPFLFYDLLRNEPTSLMIHPTTVMDVTLKDQLGLTPETALGLIEKLIHQVKAVSGEFVSLWHNESLSEWGRWKGWLPVYQELIKMATV